MYRIQAFNKTGQYWNVETCKTMEERDQIIRDMIASGNYAPASISFEWLARC